MTEISSLPRASETLLDTTGLSCPLPILKAKRALNPLPRGSLLRIIASDPVTERDFPAFCRQTGHELVTSRKLAAGRYEFVIRKIE
jgi:tRNA 2-thiouridine synthesizing protein A